MAMAHGNGPGQQQPAQTAIATRASKRARSRSNDSALAQETESVSQNETLKDRRERERKKARIAMEPNASYAIQGSEPDTDGYNGLGLVVADEEPEPNEYPAHKKQKRKQRGKKKKKKSSGVLDLTHDNELGLGAMRDMHIGGPGSANDASHQFGRDVQAEHATKRARPDPQAAIQWYIDDTALPGPKAPTFQLPDRTVPAKGNDKSVLRELSYVAQFAAKKPEHIVQNRDGPAPRDPKVMFTYQEAKRYLERVSEGVEPRPPLSTVQTGEHVPYPVTKSYHLGAMGRYMPLSQQPAPRNIAQKPAEYVFDWGSYAGKRLSEVPRIYLETILASPRLDRVLAERPDLGEALHRYKPGHPYFATTAWSMQANARRHHASAQAPEEFTRVIKRRTAFAFGGVGGARAPAMNGPYILPFGPYRGEEIIEVPLEYQKSLEADKEAWEAHAGLKEALVENYRFGLGKHKSKTIFAVPEKYLDHLEGAPDLVLDDEILQCVLRARNDRKGRSNAFLGNNIEQWNRKRQRAAMREANKALE
jgi:uncharacterized protein (DUF3820 family)